MVGSENDSYLNIEKMSPLIRRNGNTDAKNSLALITKSRAATFCLTAYQQVE